MRSLVPFEDYKQVFLQNLFLLNFSKALLFEVCVCTYIVSVLASVGGGQLAPGV